MRFSAVAFLAILLTPLLIAGCNSRKPASLVARGDTFAEMRAVKGEISVANPGDAKRAPYPRERLADGSELSLAPGALAWIRRDGGAVWLVAGPAQLTVHEDVFKMTSGRAFIDSEDAPSVRVDTPRGVIELENARASVDVPASGDEEVYVLRGSARTQKAADRASSGERLSLLGDGSVRKAPAVAWDDWTGGLATADPAAQPAPFGLGTVGARPPGDKGKPRFSLVIERLDVRVSVDHDFATTEVDQTFVNPSSDTVEGIFSFRTPPGAVLSKFGVDREGDVVWGKVKESAAAQRQYESNVYAGSTEDPALLSWVGPGTYNARLYPIAPGSKRRVVTRYAEWLTRQGPKSDRRLYVYPMAAEGARASLPRIEELRVTLDLAKSGAEKVRAGMNGRTDGKNVVIQAFDFVPRADLAVELFDGGQTDPVAYRAPHTLTAEDIPMNADSKFAAKVSAEEPDYLLVPLRSAPPEAMAKGVDLAIVIDTSAATEPGALSIARSLTSALLAHLGPDDRAALWAGDASLRPVADGSGELVAVDAVKRREWLAGLANVERGGATDIGALLTEASAKLDGKRRGAVLYVGDGLPSVGEVTPKTLKDRLARLPASTRIFTAGIGTRANVALLDNVARGAPVEAVSDAYGAARSALRLLEAAQRPAWVGATVDLGSGVERVLPRDLPPVPADENILVVGRISGATPSKITLKSGDQTTSKTISVVAIDDVGDLRRRWGQGRMQELLGEGAGRAALVDIGRRFGLVSPYTSLYVPTKREVEQGDITERENIAQARADAIERRRLWRPWSHTGAGDFESRAEMAAAPASMDREGGTGTRAKGEEGSMGNPNVQTSNKRFGVQGPQDAPAAAAARPPSAGAPREAALKEAQEFGMIGSATTTSPGNDALSARGDMWGDQIGDAFGAGGLGLSGAGEGGGGRGEGIGLGKVGSIGHGGGAAAKSAPAKRPDGAPTAPSAPWGRDQAADESAAKADHATRAPTFRQGAVDVSGAGLPSEVIQRIVRQNFGRFRLCYENGLRTNPNLGGTVRVKFVIDRSGAVATAQDAQSDLGDPAVVSCIVRSFGNLSFPQPERGNVTVTYPVTMMTEGAKAAPKSTTVNVSVTTNGGPIGVIGHVARPCGPGADLPLAERRTLWGERLAAQNSAGTAEGALNVYRRALEDCEAPSWRERTMLLLQMVDQLKTVTARVALWKSLILTPAADIVYRAIVVRVQTVNDLHEFHRALGLATVDPDMLAKMVEKVKTPSEKAGVLRAAAAKWPDDLELGLRVLDAYEDAGDDANSRAWARRLRRRADATAHVWTSVGEHYLRLASREQGPDADRDRIEARRTFGEIVEFAPEDPAARRRLGDLLRAHGWYDEALRQYMTLQTLTPDDPAVPLLIASCAAGLGRVEEAVGWAEKAAATGSPDGSAPLSRAARANAVAFIAWAREEALKANRKEDAEKLLTRARRLLAAGGKPGQQNDEQSIRVIVTWSHPELHPTLWTNTLGAPMPSPDNFLPYGVAEAKFNGAPAKAEIRLDPEDAARAARLQVKAIVTVIRGGGTPAETITHQEIGFGTVAAPATISIVNYDGAISITTEEAKPEKEAPPAAKKAKGAR